MNRLSILFKSQPKPFLGRWNVDYCQKRLNTKVMLANEDHCGTCGNSLISSRMHEITRQKTFRQANKDQTDAIRRYNEYIHEAVKSRKVSIETNEYEKEIEYYICMN